MEKTDFDVWAERMKLPTAEGLDHLAVLLAKVDKGGWGDDAVIKVGRHCSITFPAACIEASGSTVDACIVEATVIYEKRQMEKAKMKEQYAAAREAQDRGDAPPTPPDEE